MNSIVATIMTNPFRAVMKPATHWVEIGPEEADALLTLNTNNRPLNEENVLRLAQAMVDGKWINDVVDIVIDVSTQLANGQHVLNALKKSGVSIKVRLSVGVPRDAVYVWDTGRMRTALEAAFLAGKDIQNKAVVKAFSRSHSHFTGPSWTGKIQDGGTAYSLDNQDFIAWCDDNLEMALEASTAGRRLSREYKHSGRGGHISPTEGAMLWFILNQADPEDCGRFFELVASANRSGSINDPFKVLDRLLAGNDLPVGYKHNFWKKIALMVITWNNWRAGKSPQPGRLPQWHQVGADFPIAI